MTESPTAPDLSFIIPCLNEQANIGRTIVDIKACVPTSLSFEIIVVDHGSTDGSRELAEQAGAKVISHPEVRLGELRNCGARVAKGRILVFLDADVSLTRHWRDSIEATLVPLFLGDRLITGSRAQPPDDLHWTQRGYGLISAPEGEVQYLGTAHLIVSTALFSELGGFPPDRESGEDEEFGRKARARGVAVVANPDLRTVHRGAPDSFRSFALRQLWHGAGDATSSKVFLRSPTAMAGLLMVLSHGLILSSPFLAAPASRIALVTGIVSVTGVLAAKLLSRRGAIRARDVLAAAVTFYVYFWARGIGLVLRPLLGEGGKRWRSR